jgi:hypothetical protein
MDTSQSEADIRRTKARYFRYVDGKDWPALRGIFTDDATVHYPESVEEKLGIDAGIELIVKALGACTSIHGAWLDEISILSPTNASGIWAMEDRLRWIENLPQQSLITELHGFGRYFEEYRRIGDQWKISSLLLLRTEVSISSRYVKLGAVDAGEPLRYALRFVY